MFRRKPKPPEPLPELGGEYIVTSKLGDHKDTCDNEYWKAEIEGSYRGTRINKCGFSFSSFTDLYKETRIPATREEAIREAVKLAREEERFIDRKLGTEVRVEEIPPSTNHLNLAD